MKQKSWKKKHISHSSSDFSYFTPTQRPLLAFHDEQDHKWLDEVWLNVSFTQRVEALLPHGDDKGRSLLAKAVRRRDHELVCTLLHNPAMEVNRTDIYGNTPLHHAVLVKDNSVVLSLLLGSPRVITNLANRDNHTACDILDGYDKPIFELVEHCFVRRLIDHTIANYCLAHPDRILGTRVTPESIVPLQQTIRQLYEASWFLSEYRDRAFPVKLVPMALQNEIIQERFNDFLIAHK